MITLSRSARHPVFVGKFKSHSPLQYCSKRDALSRLPHDATLSDIAVRFFLPVPLSFLPIPPDPAVLHFLLIHNNQLVSQHLLLTYSRPASQPTYPPAATRLSQWHYLRVRYHGNILTVNLTSDQPLSSQPQARTGSNRLCIRNTDIKSHW